MATPNPGQFLAQLKKRQAKLDAARKGPVRQPGKPGPSRAGGTKPPKAAAGEPNKGRTGKTKPPAREAGRPSPSRAGATNAPGSEKPRKFKTPDKNPKLNGPNSMGESFKQDKPSTQTRVQVGADGRGSTPRSPKTSGDWRSLDPKGDLSRNYQEPKKMPDGSLRSPERGVVKDPPKRTPRGTPRGGGVQSTDAKEIWNRGARGKKPTTPKSTPKAPGGGIGSKIGRFATGTGGLATTFFFGDTFSSRTGNQANYGEQDWIDNKDKRGPLMKGNKKYDSAIGPKQPANGPKQPAKRREGGGGNVQSAPKAPSAAVPVPKAKPADIDRKAKADKFKKGMQGQAGVNVVTGESAGSVSKANPNANQGKKGDKATKYPGFKGNWKNAAPMESQRPKTFADATRRADGGDSYTQNKRGNKLRSWK